MSAQVTILQLPSAGAITGTESVPIVQNGVTVQTTTGAIAASPSQPYTYLTVNQTPQLANSRYFGATNGLLLNDGGAQGLFNITTTGALLSLVGSGTGFQVKTSSTDLTGRSIAVSGTGLSIANGDGIAGNPTITLAGKVLNLANLSANGLMTITSAGALSATQILGVTNQTSVSNPDGTTGSPTIGLASNPTVPGTGGITVPSGTTAQRAGSNGAFRYNTSSSVFEGYMGGSWTTFGSGNGSVTSVGVTTANGFAGTVANSTTTPTITLTTSVTGLLKGNGTAMSAAVSGTDYAPATSGASILYGNGSGGFSNVTVGSGISFSAGTLSATTTGTVSSVSVVSANGFGGTVATATTTPAITLTTSLTGLLKGNGSAMSVAVSGTDYAPATSGTAIFYGNGAGGFSNVTVGSGLSFTAGTLASTSSGGSVTSVSFTGGIVSVATATTTPALTVAGTSGGIPYFSSGTAWASSGALTASAIMLGGGAGAAPTTTTTGTGVVTAVSNAVNTTGGLVTVDGTATLTNKTLTNPTITNYVETLFTANTSTAITVALTNGTVQQLTLTGNATITMPTAVAGKSFVIMLKQDATGGRSVTWSTVAWPAGTAPTITSTASKQDIYSFFSDGTNWYGVTVGQNY